MKIVKISIVLVGLLINTFISTAQTVSLKTGETSKSLQLKGTTHLSFASNGTSYFFTKYWEQAVIQYYLESYDASGVSLAETKLEINVGVFNNSYSIDDVIGFGSNAYALVEHMDKPSGKNSLSARIISSSGKVSETEVELMSFPFEKTMNSGFNFAAVSEDNKTLAVVGELPYVKDQSAKYKVALFNTDLKEISTSEITIPGEDTKNKSMSILVANDGTVYFVKKTTSKIGELILTAYQYSPSGSKEVKEYTMELTAPLYFDTYTCSVNQNNELIIAGTYYKRQTVTVGEKMTQGIFYFTNKGKSEKVLKSFALDQPVENLTARKILLNGNTIFLATEQFKEEKITPPASAAGSAASFDYSYNYIHKNEYVIAMDTDGNKKFELNLGKDFTARDFDKQYYSAYFICNEKFTVVYNDLTKKYTEESGYNYLMPVLVQITNDGLMQSPVTFMDKLKLPSGFVLHPGTAVQTAPNSLTMLMKNSDKSQYVNLIIE